MRKLLLSCTLLFSLSLPAAEEMATFAQIISLVSQFPGDATGLVQMEIVDGINGVQTEKNSLVIKQDGTYFIMAAGQVGVEKGIETFGGFVDMWLIRNGKPIDNSGVKQTISNPQATAVLVSQSVMALKSGDVLAVGFSANREAHGLVAVEATEKEPAIPSIIFSIFRIGP